MIHELKIWPCYFNAVLEGKKTFEIRKDDREFKDGDTLILREYEIEITDLRGPVKKVTPGGYTGRSIKKEISYIFKGGLPGCGLRKEYVILGLKECIETIGNCAKCGRTLVNNEKCDCITFSKGIELKNIDLTGISLVEEMNKADEERKEFEESILLYMTVNTVSKNINEIKDAREHVIEEFWDTVQANLGILDKLGINAQEVMSGYKKHLEKIKDRPRNKEY